MAKKNLVPSVRNNEISKRGLLGRVFDKIRLSDLVISGVFILATGAIAVLGIHDHKRDHEYWDNRTFTLQKGESERFFGESIEYGGLDADGDSFRLKMSASRGNPNSGPIEYKNERNISATRGEDFTFPHPIGSLFGGDKYIFRKESVSDSELTLTYLGEK